MEDRRRNNSPIQLIHSAPPSGLGRVHTMNFTREHPGREESWLAENGIATGYVYEQDGMRLLAYIEPQTVETVPAFEIAQEVFA